MSDWQTVLEVREQTDQSRPTFVTPGPFVTISRQYGCSGFALGLLLAEILNQSALAGKAWKVYGREILEQLAEEHCLDVEYLVQLSRQKPGLVMEFVRSLSETPIPTARALRNHIAELVRGLAYRGYAIIIGQGGSGATMDLAENGLSVRLEAPPAWRICEICRRKSIAPAQAREEIVREDKDREYRRKIYSMRFPREPAFDVTYDSSRFTLAQIAQHVACLLHLRRLVP